MICWPSVRRGGDQFVALLDVDGDNAARHHVREVLEFGLLHRAVASGEEDVAAGFLEIAHSEHGAHGLAGLQCRSRFPMCLPLPAAPTSGIS